MLEVRVLSLIGAAILRLRKHQPRTCESDPKHGSVEPVVGSLELSIPELDAAVYTCSNDRCGWRRFEKLKPADVDAEIPHIYGTVRVQGEIIPVDLAEKFTVNGRNE